MPELPEIETVCRGLAPHIEGQTIRSSIIRCRQLRYPINRGFRTLVAGQTIRKLERRGKYLLCYFDQQAGLLCHLGMSGVLSLSLLDSPYRKHDHVELQFDHFCLRFNDPRRFGLLLFSHQLAQHPLLTKLGVEPLSVDFCQRYLQQKLSRKKTTIKQAIMDHRLVVGVGNIYASEALFAAAISPLKPAKDLSKQQCLQLLKAIKKTLRTAIKAGGTTLKDFADSQGRAGYFQQQLKVYDRKQQACQRCSHSIVHCSLGGRSTYYCPHCQL